MKILVVDDHALIRDALQSVMKKLQRGAVMLEASDGRQALEILAAESDVSLVLLDLSLPDRDGFLVLADIRERCPATAVVVLSAIQERAKSRASAGARSCRLHPKVSAPRGHGERSPTGFCRRDLHPAGGLDRAGSGAFAAGFLWA